MLFFIAITMFIIYMYKYNKKRENHHNHADVYLHMQNSASVFVSKMTKNS